MAWYLILQNLILMGAIGYAGIHWAIGKNHDDNNK